MLSRDALNEVARLVGRSQDKVDAVPEEDPPLFHDNVAFLLGAGMSA